VGSLGFEPRIANVLYAVCVPQAGILNHSRRVLTKMPDIRLLDDDPIGIDE